MLGFRVIYSNDVGTFGSLLRIEMYALGISYGDCSVEC